MEMKNQTKKEEFEFGIFELRETIESIEISILENISVDDQFNFKISNLERKFNKTVDRIKLIEDDSNNIQNNIRKSIR